MMRSPWFWASALMAVMTLLSASMVAGLDRHQSGIGLFLCGASFVACLSCLLDDLGWSR
jgi:hypothetical protein